MEKPPGTSETAIEAAGGRPETAPGAAPDTSINAIMASIRAGIAGGAAIGAVSDAEPEPAAPATAPAAASAAATPPPRSTPTSPARPTSPLPGAAIPSDGITLEALVRSMLTPMLKDWLDTHLPEIVEAATHAEIRRLTGRSE